MATQPRAPAQQRGITGHVDLLYPTEYIKAADLRGKDVTVTIDRAEWENLIMAGGKRDRKVVIHMRNKAGVVLPRRWVVGKTVLRQIANATGNTDVGAWSGQRVTMYPTTCKVQGEERECIRVRVRVSARAEEPTAEMSAPPVRDFVDEADDAGPADATAASA